MDSPWKGKICRINETSLDNIYPPWKGGLMMRLSLMTVMLQYERGQVRLKVLTRSNIHLWMIVSSLEDGLVGK